jgi:hypothetical protein
MAAVAIRGRITPATSAFAASPGVVLARGGRPPTIAAPTLRRATITPFSRTLVAPAPIRLPAVPPGRPVALPATVATALRRPDPALAQVLTPTGSRSRLAGGLLARRPAGPRIPVMRAASPRLAAARGLSIPVAVATGIETLLARRATTRLAALPARSTTARLKPPLSRSTPARVVPLLASSTPAGLVPPLTRFAPAGLPRSAWLPAVAVSPASAAGTIRLEAFLTSTGSVRCAARKPPAGGLVQVPAPAPLAAPSAVTWVRRPVGVEPSRPASRVRVETPLSASRRPAGPKTRVPPPARSGS